MRRIARRGQNQTPLGVLLGALVGAVLVLSPSAAASRCHAFVSPNGTAGFESITTRKVPCPRAKNLLQQATRRSVRRGRHVWSYSGFRWRLRRTASPVADRIIGRKRVAKVSATWVTL